MSANSSFTSSDVMHGMISPAFVHVLLQSSHVFSPPGMRVNIGHDEGVGVVGLGTGIDVGAG